ncbi:MAG: thioesterase family protein [Alphaproteobacteria bacterium]|nr:MAG: thioesterase family protein [Caulobacteraceae bacterium]TPW02936.1 MAG: thioesterase family protein [Alphaproteobacteria bacterium]
MKAAMSEKEKVGGYGAPIELTEGPFKGWLTWGDGHDPFETLVGPLVFRTEPDGRSRAAFMPEKKHLNGGGVIHGGALMSFADFALFGLSHEALKGAFAVTVTFNAEFVGAGAPGAMVEAEGRVVKQTKSLVFVQGVLSQGGQPILAFSGTLKKIKAPPTTV